MPYNLDKLRWSLAPGDWFAIGKAIVADLPDFDPKEGLHVILRLPVAPGMDPIMLAPASPTGIRTASGWASSEKEDEWPVLDDLFGREAWQAFVDKHRYPEEPA